MIKNIHANYAKKILITSVICLLSILIWYIPQNVLAITPLPEPDPKPGSFGLEATKKQPPPKEGATITTPGAGSSFTTSPIQVSGICPDGLLVQVYNNDVMVGAVMCEGGSFSLEVSLFAGTNELSAIVYDDLDQAGPTSSIVTITYNDTNFTAFGELVTLTSTFGRRSAVVGSQLTWPLQLSGGTGPYAFSIDWGDGTELELRSQTLAGVLDIVHTYKKAGIYIVNIHVTDVNGVSAFLQLVAVSSGEVSESDLEMMPVQNTQTKVIWFPAVIVMVLLLPTYWLGKRSQLVILKRKMEKERDEYERRASLTVHN